MTKHMAIELDATADQQAKIASIAKAAAADLRAMREKMQAARSQAVALLTAPTIDRTAIERQRTEQMTLAESASKRIAQALADAAMGSNRWARAICARASRWKVGTKLHAWHGASITPPPGSKTSSTVTRACSPGHRMN